MNSGKRTVIIIFALLVLVGGFVFLKIQKWQAPPAPAQAKALYYCPMHPQVTSDKPGDCPICHMKLVKREDASSSSTAEKQKEICYLHNCPMMHDGQPCPMLVVSKTGKPAICPVCGNPEEDNPAVKGNAPAGYSSVELTPQKRQMVGITTAKVERQKLVKEIRAVGSITERNPVSVTAHVYEFEIPFLDRGQRVIAEIPAFNNERLEGTVRSVDRNVDLMTRTVHIQVLFPQAKGLRFKTNMFVNVTILAEMDEALAVPVEAVLDSGERQIVFVDKGDGILEPREVDLGSRTKEFYLVKAGIKEGEVVVTSANFLIDSESRLKAGLESFSNEQQHNEEKASPTKATAAPITTSHAGHGGQ